jgi:hypothetical protein
MNWCYTWHQNQMFINKDETMSAQDLNLTLDEPAAHGVLWLFLIAWACSFCVVLLVGAPGGVVHWLGYSTVSAVSGMGLALVGRGVGTGGRFLARGLRRLGLPH